MQATKCTYKYYIYLFIVFYLINLIGQDPSSTTAYHFLLKLELKNFVPKNCAFSPLGALQRAHLGHLA